MTRSGFMGRWWSELRSALNSLQFKASLLVVLLVLIVTLAGMALSLRLSAEAIYAQAGAQTAEWAASLASAAAVSVERKDTENLVKAVNDSLRTGGVAYLAFGDDHLKLLAAGEDAPGLLQVTIREEDHTLRVDTLGSPQLVRPGLAGKSFVDVTVPVYGDAAMPGQPRSSRKVIGYLRLATNVVRADACIAQIGVFLGRISVGLLLLAALCSLVAMRKVVSPLNELALTARRLASGVMDARARVRAHNEIGDLAQAFNHMADRLAGTQLEMLRMNAELEERVQQRTHQLEDLASRDALTGLYNRRYFSDMVSREFAAAERYDADLACLMFDLDKFKEINDRFGHRMGDEVLMLAAESIRAELRESDVAARFGGDEFILLLPRTSASQASNVAERIIGRFAETAHRDSPEIPATMSIGVASLRVTRARTAEALIHEADLALYSAKMAGRNRTVAATGAHA